MTHPLHTASLQIFKWEERKAWSELLAAFLEEFGSSESVSLTLLTHPYHGQADFASQMHAWATQTLGVPGTVHILPSRIPPSIILTLYSGFWTSKAWSFESAQAGQK